MLAIYNALSSSADGDDVQVAFLTLDSDYARTIALNGISVVDAASPRSAVWLATANAMVTDHGLHAMLPLLWFSDLKFFDAWHGIPFKGFDGDDFRVQHRYDEMWVSSPLLQRMYVERFGFPADIVHVTGYARTDRLVRRDGDVAGIKRRLGLDPASVDKLVLFAPTWKQDARNRSLFPFGVGEEDFFNALSQLGARLGATFLMRAHLNSGPVAGRAFDRIVAVPFAHFPDTEEILLVSDILVCDWSSIAFDYLVLDRPTIFLDVEPPFAKGFSLDASHRFGAVVGDMDALIGRLEQFLLEPDRYAGEFSIKAQEIRSRVYDRYADGNATDRCVQRLRQHLVRGGSSR